MTSPTRIAGAAVLIAPLGVFALSLQADSAQAADILDTLKEQPQFSTLAKAIESAGMAEALQGEGPFTVFAPTNEAFSQLPQGATDKLMEEANQATLEALIAQHVVEGKEIMAEEVLGEQRKLTTLQGDTLTIDGINPTMLLVPTGLAITRIDDRVIVQREGVAVPAGSIEVQTQVVRRAAGGSQQAGQEAQSGEQQTAVSEQGDMPMSPHQQQALATDPEQESTQTGTTGGMPATEHQQQVLAGAPTSSEQAGSEPAGGAQPMQGQPGQQSQAAQSGEQQTAVSGQGDMPMSPHQQQVLATDPEQQSTQTGGTAMPSTKHQRQVLAEPELQGEQTQYYQLERVKGLPDVLREAALVEADIMTDNGVIHAIDRVLVPQAALSELESVPGQMGAVQQDPVSSTKSK